jgi:hypothetical protein
MMIVAGWLVYASKCFGVGAGLTPMQPQDSTWFGPAILSGQTKGQTRPATLMDA